MIKVRGYLLSYLKYGDDDAIINTFTKEKGFLPFFVKKLYSKNNKQKAFLSPLNEIEFSLNKSSENFSLSKIQKMEILQFPESFADIKTNSILFFVADFLNQILKNEGQNVLLYKEISSFINQIENKNWCAHHIFLIRTIQSAGLSPLHSENEFLDPESGNYFTTQTNPNFTKDISSVWKDILQKEVPYSYTIPPKIRKELLSSILIYCQYHFTQFKNPASLEVLQELF